MPLGKDGVDRLNKMLTSKTNSNRRPYINDKNLQINVPEIREQIPAKELAKTSNAMDEAKKSFETMMKFHKQIEKAYQDVVKML